MDENKMKEACDLLNYHKLFRRTPIMNAEKIINLPTYVELWFKLENMQNTGSFEIRGVINQVENIDKKGKFKKILTISQGNINYAKALSLISKQYERSRPLILLSGYFSRNAYKIIEKLGLGIEFVEKGMLQETIDSYLEENNMIFLHPYDDYNLIAGYARLLIKLLKTAVKNESLSLKQKIQFEMLKGNYKCFFETLPFPSKT
ncbi:L-threonine dehydratase catabolic TdcB-like [Gordionus sp. m RMFG-2023]|uniref:L-threonine dehydratase catabolic TdcB-like n=1 Tax=Gordionus sp. m RMFG-2023 TaxID=3053472 RepID=UPI0031FC867C